MMIWKDAPLLRTYVLRLDPPSLPYLLLYKAALISGSIHQRRHKLPSSQPECLTTFQWKWLPSPLPICVPASTPHANATRSHTATTGAHTHVPLKVVNSFKHQLNLQAEAEKRWNIFFRTLHFFNT